jgi:hypothetical protein
MAQIFGQDHVFRNHPELYTLMANIIREHLLEPDPCSFDKIMDHLKRSELHLNQINSKYLEQKGDHFPMSKG